MKSLVGKLVESKNSGQLYTVLAVELTRNSDGYPTWAALLTEYLGSGNILSVEDFECGYRLIDSSRKQMEI